MRILAIDDRDPESIQRASASAGVTVDVPQTDLKQLLIGLFSSVNDIIKGDSTNTSVAEFKDYDIILLDFGLTTLHFQEFPFRLTAEHIAGYIRALTDVPYVVMLNKLGKVDFDLKYLLGDFETRADLALHTDLLTNGGLWSGSPTNDDFCPWYWPTLNNSAERRRKQIEFVRERLNMPILQSLAFPEKAIEQLSLQAIGFLSSEAEDDAIATKDNVRNITFWQHFLASNRTLIRDDRSELLGVTPQDLLSAKPPESSDRDEAIKTVAARVIAGELDYWFRRDILGPQRLLIDAPHLQTKYRFRPGEEEGVGPETWTTTAREFTPPYGLSQEFYESVKEFEFAQKYPSINHIWTDKPCFWLPLIEEDADFIAMAENHPRRRNNFIFCEDTRRFVDEKSARPQRFQTALGRGVDVRYIERIEQINYSPKSQLAR